MITPIALQVQPRRTHSRHCRSGTIDPVQERLQPGLIGGRGITSIEIVDVIDRIGNTQPVDDLSASLHANVNGLAHGQAGGIPVGGQRVGGDGNSCTTHAHSTWADDGEFYRQH